MPDDATATTVLPEPLGYEPEELQAIYEAGVEQLDPIRLAISSPLTVAQLLEKLDVEERRQMLRLVPEESASAILGEMDEEDAAEVVAEMREARAARLLADLDPDDAADVIGELDEADQDRLLDRLDDETAATVKELLAYDAETAGGVMNPDVVNVLNTATVAEAIATVREASAQREDLHYLYIVDEAELLVGLVTLRRLLLASESTPVSRIMKQRSELRGIVTPEVDRERVALLMAEYNLPDIIVVDDEGYLLGEVTHDDVIDIIQREATEDLQKLVGAGGDEGVNDELSYSIRRRLPWLYVNLGSAALAATVVATFEHRIDLLPLLAVFMPIVASMGGNTGMQTLSVAIRGIALGEFQKADNRRILIKELGAGIFNGLAVGLSTGLIVYLWKGDIVLASVLTLALIATMGLAGLAGATIPILLRRFNLDPAQSSSIFLTTVTDVVGFLIFLSLGSWMLL